MKTIFKGNKFGVIWNIFHSTTNTPFDFTGLNVEVSLFSNNCSTILPSYKVSGNTIECEIESETLPVGVYDIMCRYSSLQEQAYCFYRHAFQISNNPMFAPLETTVDIQTYASHINKRTVFSQFNSLFLQYLGSPENTRNNIPLEIRRPGLIITYTNDAGETITERSRNDIQKENDHWGLNVNWSRIDELSLSGEISVSANGTWVINGEETNVQARGPKGETGLTPWLKTIDNKLHFSYDNINWEECSDYIAHYFRVHENKLQISADKVNWEECSDYIAHYFRVHENKLQISADKVNWEECSDYIAHYFRFSTEGSTAQGNLIGSIQISDDNRTWRDLSPKFENNLRIAAYVATSSDLPTGKAVGTIYGVGPTYAAEDTGKTNPIYRLYVYNGETWVDNGSFTSIAAGIVQETGDNENVVMSQKAVTEKLSELGSEIRALESYFNYQNFLQGYIKTGDVGTTIESYKPTSSSEFVYCILPVSKGDKFYIEGKGGVSGRLWAFVGADNIVTNSASVSYTSRGEYIEASETDNLLIITFRIATSYKLYKHSRYDDEISQFKVEFSEELSLTKETIESRLSILESYFNYQNFLQGYIKTGDVGTTIESYKPTSSSEFVYCILPVSNGDKFYIEGKGGVYGRLWAFVDENNIVTNSASVSYVSGGEYIEASETDNLLVVCFRANEKHILQKQSRFDEELNEVSTKLQDIVEISVAPTNVGHLSTNVGIGNVVDLNRDSTSEQWNYYLVPINEKNIVRLANCKGGGNSRLWAFVDEEYKLLSISGAYAEIGITPLQLEIPQNAKLLIINNSTEDGHNAKVLLSSEGNLTVRVENLEQKINNGVNSSQTKVLIIGNSFSYRATCQGGANLLRLADSLGIDMYLSVVGNSSASFYVNYNSAINDKTNEYRWEGDSYSGPVSKEEKLTLKESLMSKEWDYIILHQGSKLSGDIASFTPYLNDLIDFIKTYCTNENVKIGLMQTWAYATNEYPTTNTTPLFNAQEDMFNAICSTYKQAEKDFDVEFIIPCGTALQNARNTELGISYSDFASSETDGVHINSYGTLITSLCVFNKVYGAKHNIKLSEIANYGNLLSDEEFEVAKKCVREAILFPFPF